MARITVALLLTQGALTPLAVTDVPVFLEAQHRVHAQVR